MQSRLLYLLLKAVKLRRGEKLRKRHIQPVAYHFIVNSFGLQLLPYRIFLMLDGGSAHTVASLLMLMFLCSHRRSILILTASIVCILAS